ncbi:MAG: DUF1592 domain-containing protein [Pirellulaceae bacterium]
MPSRFVIVLIAITSCLVPRVLRADDDVTRLHGLLAGHCNDCHQGNDAEAHLDMTKFNSVESVGRSRDMWVKIRQRIETNEMPPEDGDPFSAEDRQWVLDWIDNSLRSTACGDGPQPGPSPLRRLNKNEYRATIRDLLKIHVDIGAELPEDGAGGSGFDNAAETLFLSPIHGEKYLDAAKAAISYAQRNQGSRDLILVRQPGDKSTEEEAAHDVLQRFATRAFRRPASEDEVEDLMRLYRQRMESGSSWDDSVFFTLQVVLISPDFLFRIEQPNLTEEPRLVSDHEMATRLSYFLWGTTPDRKLMQAADEGKLTNADSFREETVRMLKVGESRGLAENFVGQWLGTRELGRQARPDQQMFRQYDQQMQDSFQEEPLLLFHEIFKYNESLLSLIDADYTFANDQLARHYGIRDKLTENISQRMIKVKLPEDTVRGGILTMSGPLTVSSFPNRTSPVLRGKWLLENILGIVPPPPPPDVPELAEEGEDVAGKSVRERLQIHRENPSCATCHNTIDPVGFGLENFDAIGRWREEDNGTKVDSAGKLPGGEAFTNPKELKQAVLRQKEKFVTLLTEKMLSYALGRGLVPSDYCAVEEITQRLAAHDYQAHQLVLGIVESVPFRYKASQAAPPTTDDSTVRSE